MTSYIMGRVRRYKKYKAIDPFAKKRAQEEDLIHDQPLAEEEEEPTTTAAHRAALAAAAAEREAEEPPERSQSKRKRKRGDGGGGGGASGEDAPFKVDHALQKELAAEAQQARTLLGLGSGGGGAGGGTSRGTDKAGDAEKRGQNKRIKIEARKPGESMKAFRTRIREEKQRLLVQQVRDASSTRKKRKQYLTDHKAQAKAAKQPRGPRTVEEELEEFPDRPTATGIGRQADRPPTLSVKPRGADKAKARFAATQSKSHGKKPGMTPSKQLEMERMRAKVMAAYKQNKKKRGAEVGLAL